MTDDSQPTTPSDDTGEYDVPAAPVAKRRRIRATAAALAAVVAVGLSGYAVGHVSAGSSTSQVNGPGGQSGGQPPSGQMPSGVPTGVPAATTAKSA